MSLNHYKTSFLKDLDAKYKDPSVATLVKSLFNGLFSYCTSDHISEPYTVIVRIESNMRENLENIDDFSQKILFSLNDKEKEAFNNFNLTSPEVKEEIFKDFFKVIRSEYLLLKRERYYEKKGIDM